MATQSYLDNLLPYFIVHEYHFVWFFLAQLDGDSAIAEDYDCELVEGILHSS